MAIGGTDVTDGTEPLLDPVSASLNQRNEFMKSVHRAKSSHVTYSSQAGAYRMVIRSAEGERIPSVVRLKGIIKALLRSFGFRVVTLEPVSEETEGET